MGTSMWSLIVLLPVLVMLAIGLVLFVLGMRGRLVHTRPTCARCRFDLSGVLNADFPGTEAICPECGSKLIRSRDLRLGHRKRRHVYIGFGVLLVLVSTTFVAGLFASRLQASTIAPRLPNWALISILPFDPSSVYFIELSNRWEGGLLSQSERASIANQIVVVHANANIPWTEPWIDLLNRALASNDIADADLKAMLTRSFAYTLETSDSLSVGGMLALERTPVFTRWGADGFVGFRTMVIMYRDTSGAVANRYELPGTQGMHGIASQMNSHTTQYKIPNLTPGEYDLEVTMNMLIDWRNIQRHENALLTRPFIYRKRVQVRPENESLVRITRNLEAFERTKAATTVRKVILYQPGLDGNRRLDVYVYFSSIPANIGYRVTVRPTGQVDAPVIELGTIAHERHEVPGHGFGFNLNVQVAAQFAATPLDITFTPDAFKAEQVVGIVEIIDGSWTIEGVPMREEVMIR